MNKKIMAFVYSEKGNYLLLKTNPEIMKCDMWFIVTGSVEKGETDEEAVKREVEEETSLEIINISKSNYSCVYECPEKSGKFHKEKAFLVKVKENTPKLSCEHLEYKWLSKEDFIKEIDWDENIDSKDKLIEILNKK